MTADSQTEPVERVSRWTQYPPQDLKGFGLGDDAESLDTMDDAPPDELRDVSGLGLKLL
jgi:hypothetical protein